MIIYKCERCNFQNPKKSFFDVESGYKYCKQCIKTINKRKSKETNKFEELKKNAKKGIKSLKKEGKKIKKELNKALDDINGFKLDMPDLNIGMEDFKLELDSRI